MHHKAVLGAIVLFVCVAQTVGIADCTFIRAICFIEMAKAHM